ncbi:hypothetical protein [Nonomuraea rubra]|uniref:hypothetical protein n=1 Tax=Nonomuraea rubra TaxID=46180 RepID=UPI0033F55811
MPEISLIQACCWAVGRRQLDFQLRGDVAYLPVEGAVLPAGLGQGTPPGLPGTGARFLLGRGGVADGGSVLSAPMAADAVIGAAASELGVGGWPAQALAMQSRTAPQVMSRRRLVWSLVHRHGSAGHLQFWLHHRSIAVCNGFLGRRDISDEMVKRAAAGVRES